MNKLNGLTLRQAELLKSGLQKQASWIKPSPTQTAEQAEKYQSDFEDICYLAEQLETIINNFKKAD